ncbi:CLUMA_CG020109, isoform A [Clunio marinus]|uniref:CLUMA_CG020109, isoform A n=1 Tax=Clunio marinus TaxID=568069 RepID=A0A1J1J3Y3_9DIPT|nr:CLUMA_CG020109, isoform A [Clunio marinus]
MIMKYQGTFLVCVVLFTFAVDFVQPQQRKPNILRCPPTSNCTCMEYNELEIQCPRYEAHVFVRIMNNNVHFECDNMTDNEYELIPEIQLDEARFLQVMRCPLPHGKSIASYLKNIRIGRIRFFQFVSSGVNQNIPIEAQHFEGLGDIEQFDLRGIENEIKELPHNLFTSMENLTWVRIRVANIHLPVDLFAPLKNLEFLELGHNKLQTLEPGFLRNQQKLVHLNLWGNSLRNLSKNSFIGLEMVRELDLSTNNMEKLESDTFFHLVNLMEINLSSNNFSSLPARLFANNKKLKALKLLENRVPLSLPNKWLANLNSLTTVYIKCELQNIPEDIFEGSHNIEIIHLANNAIENLPENLLVNQNNLRELDLSGNRIPELYDAVFLGCSSLKKLSLTRNRLKIISNYSFKPLSSLTHLYLNDNQIHKIEPKAFKGITSVEFITLENNKLNFQNGEEIIYDGVSTKTVTGPFQSLQQLEYLNLANNSITEIFEDYTLMSLKTLNLSYNQISLLSTADLESLTRNGLTIDLTHNRIEEINFAKDIDPTMSAVNVLLDDNPLVCDCRILHFIRHLKKIGGRKIESGSNIEVSVGNLKCANPNKMTDRFVRDINPLELICPLDNIQTAKKRCPNGCSCEARPEDRHLLIHCTTTVDIHQLPIATDMNFVETELNIENSSLTNLPTVSKSAGYNNVTKLFANGNRISSIMIENIPNHLRVLNLKDNNLKLLNDSVIKFITNSSYIEQLFLSNNPWQCDCESLEFMNFVQKFRQKIVDYSEIKCKDGRKFNVLKPSDLCSDDNLFVIIISIITALLGLILGGFAALYYKYQKQIKMWLYSHNSCLWLVTEDELDKDKRYDAFVSYSHRDQDFVADFLLPELENGTIPYKLCVHERDWTPGLEISTQISNSVNDAKRTIIVMSSNYLQSNWAQWEFRVAQSHAATEKRSRIIVILYGDIGDINKLEPDIRDYLKLNTYVKWGDKWFWEKLKYAMPHVKSSERMEKLKGLTKTSIKSSVDDKLELIKPVSITPPQLTTPPSGKVVNPLITTLNTKNTTSSDGTQNGNGGHINGAFVINTGSRQSDV